MILNAKKEYTQEEINSSFRKNKCPECCNPIKRDGSESKGWVYRWNCIKCGTKYKFIETDMGQTSPWLGLFDVY